MQRSKFPYTANSSAKVIRHAVSIDERRAKFRQDLISESKPSKSNRHLHHHHILQHHKNNENVDEKQAAKEDEKQNEKGGHASQPEIQRFRRRSSIRPMQNRRKSPIKPLSTQDEEGHLMPRQTGAEKSKIRSSSPADSYIDGPPDEDDLDEAAEQDIEELWFPGCHADLGGGWPADPEGLPPLSHGPLVWMVTEAQKAGLNFDRDMMMDLKCEMEDFDEPDEPYNSALAGNANNPKVEITSSSNSNFFGNSKSEKQDPGWAPGLAPENPKRSEFHERLHQAFTKGQLHNCLEYKNGLPWTSVLSWKAMEYMPFRRMDLQPDGSWKAISFPLV